MTGTEVEFKYNAENISLIEFTKFCESKLPKSFIIASGYDHFYYNNEFPESFQRLRMAPDFTQLTFKRKTTDKNSFVRDEDNIDLDPKVTRDQVASYLSKQGYEYNTSIFKNAFVYKYEWYTLSYYMVYDIGMKELARFVELEMNEDFAWSSEAQVWNELVILEKLTKSLGIVPQARIKKSLFELVKK